MPNHQDLLKSLINQDAALSSIYTSMSKDLANVLKKYKVNNNSKLWFKNAEVKKEVDAVMANYQNTILNHISNESTKAWDLSNKHNDAFVKAYTKGITIANPSLYTNRNTEALQAFLKRQSGGLNLSDRVWNLTDKTKSQLEYFIAEGLTEGRPSSALATDLKRYLQQPEKRFRRIRDKETGKLKLSNPAENYNPGRGVYRSSYQNALRLARNEVNIAYRSSDQVRRAQLPFVLGVTVNLSSAHKVYDICDELKGDYPKDFQFIGWHPNCLCFTTSKLASKQDFINHLKGQQIPSDKFISNIPSDAAKYLNDNAERLKSYKNKPYFLADNFKNTKDGFALKNGIGIGSELGKVQPVVVNEQTSKLGGLVDSIKKNNNISYNDVKLGSKLTELEMIEKIGGGDLTKGSCASLSLAYIGNSLGFDVIDFRGGNSWNFFARSSNLNGIVEGLGGLIKKEFNDFTAAKSLLASVVNDKEYMFVVGKHASIIKKTKDKGFQYLELQSAIDNGYKPLTNDMLKKRFGCQTSYKSYGQKLQRTSSLIDIEDFRDDESFREMLGYINTKKGEQLKGARGRTK